MYVCVCVCVSVIDRSLSINRRRGVVAAKCLSAHLKVSLQAIYARTVCQVIILTMKKMHAYFVWQEKILLVLKLSYKHFSHF